MEAKPVRQLSDDVKITAYCVQLFLELTRPEQLRIIRIMEHLNEEKEEKDHGKNDR